jgi:hypothetical protein
MTNMRLVTIETEAFTATVPWTYAIPPMQLIDIMAEQHSMIQFAKAFMALRVMVAPEILPGLEELNILELTEVISQWISKSMELNNEPETS